MKYLKALNVLTINFLRMCFAGSCIAQIRPNRDVARYISDIFSPLELGT